MALRWRGLEDGPARYVLSTSLGIARLGVARVAVLYGVALSQGVRMIPRGDHGAYVAGCVMVFRIWVIFWENGGLGHYLG